MTVELSPSDRKDLTIEKSRSIQSRQGTQQVQSPNYRNKTFRNKTTGTKAQRTGGKGQGKGLRVGGTAREERLRRLRKCSGLPPRALSNGVTSFNLYSGEFTPAAGGMGADEEPILQVRIESKRKTGSLRPGW